MCFINSHLTSVESGFLFLFYYNDSMAVQDHHLSFLFVHSNTHLVLTHKTPSHTVLVILSFSLAFVEPPKTKKIPTGAVSIFRGNY